MVMPPDAPIAAQRSFVADAPLLAVMLCVVL
jgi:hypothetical protein